MIENAKPRKGENAKDPAKAQQGGHGETEGTRSMLTGSGTREADGGSTTWIGPFWAISHRLVTHPTDPVDPVKESTDPPCSSVSPCPPCCAFDLSPFSP